MFRCSTPSSPQEVSAIYSLWVKVGSFFACWRIIRGKCYLRNGIVSHLPELFISKMAVSTTEGLVDMLKDMHIVNSSATFHLGMASVYTSKMFHLRSREHVDMNIV